MSQGWGDQGRQGGSDQGPQGGGDQGPQGWVQGGGAGSGGGGAPSGGWGQAPPAQGWVAPATGPSPGPVRFRPLGIGDVIDGAFKLFRADLREILLAVGLVVVPAQIILAALQVGVLSNLAVLDESTFDADVALSFASGLGGIFVVGFITGLLLLVAHAVVLRIAGARLFGAQETARDAFRGAFRLFGKLLGNSLLKSLALAALFIPATALFVVAAATDARALGIGLGAMAFLAAGGVAIWLYVGWALTEVVIVLEDAGAIAAFGRSRQLVRGRWWPTLGVLALTALVVGVIGSLIGALPQQLGGFLVTFQAVAGAALIAIGGILSSLITQPLSVLVSLMLWTDLRVRKEGLDLQVAERMREEGAGGSAPAPSAGQEWQGGQGSQGWQGSQGGQGWDRPG